MQLVNKKVPVREPVLQNALVFLVKVYLKPVLDNSSKVGYYEVDFCDVYIKLHGISAEVEITLEQEIIKLVRLSTTEDVIDISFISS